MIRWIPPVLAVIIVVFVLRRLGAFLVERGWLYGRGEGPARGNAVGGLGFEQVFQPSIEHVFEEQQRLQIEADHETPGDGSFPTPGPPRGDD